MTLQVWAAGYGAPLSADMVACAVVAAARVYGDDPIVAMANPEPGRHRRCVAAATEGLADAAGVMRARLFRVMRLPQASFYRAKGESNAQFVAAVAAARRAVREGPLAALIAAAPPSPPPAPPCRVLTTKRLQAEILRSLAEAPASIPVLVARLNVAEGVTRAALLELREAGRVTATRPNGASWRSQTWRVVAHGA